MDEEALIASLPDLPAATWEIAPCVTWTVTDEANPLLLHGAFVKHDEQAHVHGTRVDVWLRDMAQNVARRLERITPGKSTYLPVEDRYVAAENGLDEYVELLLAFEQAGSLLGESTWTQMAQRRLGDITESIVVHAERWTELRTTIAWLVLRDAQQRAGQSSMQTTGSRASLTELREWILAQPLRLTSVLICCSRSVSRCRRRSRICVGLSVSSKPNCQGSGRSKFQVPTVSRKQPCA